MRKKISKFVKTTGSTAAIALTSASAAFATNTIDISTINSPAGNDGLETVIVEALRIVIGLSAVIAVAVLIYGGILYIIAAGDEGKVDKASKAIMYAIVGLIICFISIMIVEFILRTFLGVE